MINYGSPCVARNYTSTTVAITASNVQMMANTITTLPPCLMYGVIGAESFDRVGVTEQGGFRFSNSRESFFE